MQLLTHFLKQDSGATAGQYAVVAFAITLVILLAAHGFGLR